MAPRPAPACGIRDGPLESGTPPDYSRSRRPSGSADPVGPLDREGRLRGTASSGRVRRGGRRAPLRPRRPAAPDGSAAPQPADPPTGEGARRPALRAQHPLRAADQRGGGLPRPRKDSPGRTRRRGGGGPRRRAGRVRPGHHRFRGGLLPRDPAPAHPRRPGRPPGPGAGHDRPDLCRRRAGQGRGRFARPRVRPARRRTGRAWSTG